MRTELKKIRDAYEALYFSFDEQSVNYGQQLFDLCVEEENGHRKWGPDFAKYHPGAISARDAGRLFAVKRVAEYLRGDKLPEIKDYLHMQKSCFVAAAMALEYGENIRGQWKDFDLNWLAELDCCDFVKAQTPKQEAAA